jgi:hypothetical protein
MREKDTRDWGWRKENSVKNSSPYILQHPLVFYCMTNHMTHPSRIFPSHTFSSHRLMTYCFDPISIQYSYLSFQGVGHVLHIVSWPIILIPSSFNIPINCFRAQGMRSVSDVRRLDCDSGYRAWDQFLMWNIDRVSGRRVWDHQGLGRCSVRWGFYIKENGFPSFVFLHPLSPHSQLLYHSPKYQLLLWPPTLKISSALLVRLVVPQSGTWKPSSVSRLVLPLRTQCVLCFSYIFF